MAEHPPGDVSATFAALYREALAHARFVESGDVTWRVYELPALPYDRRKTPTLIFDHEYAMHRVREYPPEWRKLSDRALLAVLGHP